MKKKTICVVDPDPRARKQTTSALKKAGYRVLPYATAKELFLAESGLAIDLILLDATGDETDAFDACAHIQALRGIPVALFVASTDDLTALADETRPREGYLIKPLDEATLTRQVAEILQRVATREQALADRNEPMEFADVRIEPARGRASVGQGALQLSPNELGVLTCLMRHARRPVSRAELLERVWGSEGTAQMRVVDDTVKRLRRKVAATRLVIETVWGYGFRLRARL